MEPYEENLTSIKNFLQGTVTAWKNSPIAEYNKLILEQGNAFHKVAHSNSTPETKEWRKRHRPKFKQCFYNAQLFIVTADVGEYYEGYCFDGLIPFHHGWIVLDGKVIDFTLEARDRSLKRKKIENNAANPVYLGVSIPKRVIMENIVKTRITEPIAQKHYLKSKMRFL